MKKKTPLLDSKIKKEQNVDRPDGKSKSGSEKEPVKENPVKVPESNDPAGYGDSGNIKKSPFKKE